MKTYSRWLGLAVSLCAVLSIALGTMATTGARAASSHQATHAAKKPASARCTKRAKASGSVVYSDWEFPDSLNPYQTTEAVSFATINGILEGLFGWDNKAKLYPDMATKVPTTKNGLITNGGKTITVNLKPGMRWSNGQEITAADIKFSWQVGMDKATGPYCVGTCDNIARIDTKGKYTDIFHMRSVYAPAVSSAISGYPIFPQHWKDWTSVTTAANKLAQDTSYNFENTSYPTNGAYQVSEFTNNERIVLTPMKYYSVMNCGPYLRQAIFSFYSSKPGMIAAAASGATDITGLGGGYTAADVPQLKQHKNYTLSDIAGFNYEFLEMNHDATYQGKPNPIANTKVRLALALAMDKVGVIQSALGISASQAKGILAWTPWVNTPTLVQQFTDKKVNGQWDPLANHGKGAFVLPGRGQALADAKKLLAQTPFKGGFTVDLYTTSGNPVRAATVGVITANWARIGVQVKPNFIPASKLFADYQHGGTLNHGDFQVALHGFSTSPEPDGNRQVLTTRYIDRRQSTHSPVNENSSAISDPVIDREMNTAAHTFNNKARQKAYSAVQVTMDQKAHWIMLYWRPVIATWDSKVKGVSNNPTSAQVTWNIFNYKAAS